MTGNREAMTPEEKARVKIDQMFEDACWKVVDRDFYTPTLTAAAIREGLLEGNREADYFLFINGMAVGVLEAKRKEVDVTSEKLFKFQFDNLLSMIFEKAIWIMASEESE